MKTSLNIISHPDDDLLFLNPDIILDIANDIQPWVLYMTYGDDGQDTSWRRKMQASQAAYPTPNYLNWLGLRSNSIKSGDPFGMLYRLYNKQVLGEFDFFARVGTHDSIVASLISYISLCKPSVIRTHNPNRQPAIDKDEPELDHIDHIYTAKFVLEAASQFAMIPVYGYEGYPIRYKEPNISAQLTDLKKQMWRKYQELEPEVAGEIWDVALDKCYKEQIQ